MIKLIVAKYLGMDPKAVILFQTKWGKPIISTKDSLHFNVSHSGDYCLLAFSQSSEIGVDIEYIDHSFEMEHVIEHIYTNEEAHAWRDLPFPEKIEKSYQKWVCFEAYLKALGKGWLADEEIIAEAKAIDPYIPLNGCDKKVYTKQPLILDIIPKYACALCVLRPPYFVKVYDGDALLSCNDHMFFPTRSDNLAVFIPNRAE